jgi:hypothetical protein
VGLPCVAVRREAGTVGLWDGKAAELFFSIFRPGGAADYSHG